MQILHFKSSLIFLICSLLFIALFIPDLSYAYGRRHHIYSRYSYGHHGYSRHYGYHKYGRHGYYPRKYYGRYSYYPRKYYRGDYYNPPSRRYRKFPKSYVNTYSYSAPVYSQLNNKPYEAESSSTNRKNVGINSPAWSTLVQGQYKEAVNIFAEQAQNNPSSSVLKVGYALAIASSGNLERGVWAMRRAFRIDPDSLHYLQLDKKGDLLIDNLIGQYTSQQNGDDQSFMVSALYYLKHDYSAAKEAIANTDKYQDNSSSFINLKKLIEQ